MAKTNAQTDGSEMQVMMCVEKVMTEPVVVQKKRSRWLEFFVDPGKLAQEYVQAHGRKIEEVMSGAPMSIGPANMLAQAVDLMMRHKIKRLPVVDGEKIVGILSRPDLMRAMWRSLPALDSKALDDEHIRQDILAGLSAQSWSKNGFVRVKVDHGVAELTGTIFDERERQAIMVATENVRGVVSVIDQIVWVDTLSGTMLGPP